MSFTTSLRFLKVDLEYKFKFCVVLEKSYFFLLESTLNSDVIDGPASIEDALYFCKLGPLSYM